MLIGLDFDNTIVRYDGVFHTVALERGYIDPSVQVSKVAVRDRMRALGQEEAWIELQGYVYGCRMDLAEIFDGALAVMRSMKDWGHQCAIISHKTRRPYMGPAYDLHRAASAWIHDHLTCGGDPLIDANMVSFHETKAEKIDRIAAMGCDVFVDDLPEILLADSFPGGTRGILFDPDGHHVEETRLERVDGWAALGRLLA